jgi:hypothetical protein
MNGWRTAVLVDRGKRLTADIIGYWSFEEGTGSTVVDRSSQWRPATWQGTLGSQWGAGIIGGGGTFNGTNNWLNTNASPGSIEAFSMSAWVLPASLPAQSLLIDAGQAAGDVFVSYMAAPLQWTTRSTGPTSLQMLVPTPPPQVGVWQHVVYCVDLAGCYQRLYINGATVAQQAFAPGAAWAPLTTALAIGARRSASLMVAGQMDEVGLWRRALSAREAAVLYNGGSGLAWPLRA